MDKEHRQANLIKLHDERVKIHTNEEADWTDPWDAPTFTVDGMFFQRLFQYLDIPLSTLRYPQPSKKDGYVTRHLGDEELRIYADVRGAKVKELWVRIDGPNQFSIRIRGDWDEAEIEEITYHGSATVFWV